MRECLIVPAGGNMIAQSVLIFVSILPLEDDETLSKASKLTDSAGADEAIKKATCGSPEEYPKIKIVVEPELAQVPALSSDSATNLNAHENLDSVESEQPGPDQTINELFQKTFQNDEASFDTSQKGVILKSSVLKF